MVARDIPADEDVVRDARVRRVTGIIWLSGILAAVVIFISSTPTRDDSGEYRPEDSKIYTREVQKFGGRGELLVQDINAAFYSLWHGRSLAFTTLALTALACFSYRFVAR